MKIELTRKQIFLLIPLIVAAMNKTMDGEATEDSIETLRILDRIFELMSKALSENKI